MPDLDLIPEDQGYYDVDVYVKGRVTMLDVAASSDAEAMERAASEFVEKLWEHLGSHMSVDGLYVTETEVVEDIF